MTSDRDALLAAICANPEEDTPRLVYADWLEENGEHERAEFIRLQCELARLFDDGGEAQPVYEFLRDRDFVTLPSADWTKIDDGIHRRAALAMRADDLLRRHASAWLPKLPKKYKVSWEGFHRGFPHRVTLGSPRKLGEVAARLRGSVPPVTLVENTFTPGLVDHLADAGLLECVGGLSLSLAAEGGSGLRDFGHRAAAVGVRSVSVQYGLGDDCAAALAESPNWTGLRSLDLSETSVGAGTAEALFRAPHLRTLKRLHLQGSNDWTPDTIRALASGGFTELVSLRLVNCGLTDDAAEALADCQHFAKLRELDLGYNALTGRGVTALLTSPHLANVSFLGLEFNAASGLDAERLAEAKPAALRMLHAHGCNFTTKDVRALARSPRLRTLWYLDLDQNNLTTAAVRELVRGFKDWCPPIVWLTHNRIDDRGAEVLAKWKAASNLRVLHLKYNRMTDAGAEALLASPHLANLDGLGLSGIGDGVDARMRTRFRHHDIVYG
jgi:uncharacterized protein (TIGR02996 family)